MNKPQPPGAKDYKWGQTIDMLKDQVKKGRELLWT